LVGPVDLVQIHLENTEMVKKINDKNLETIDLRKSIYQARKAKMQLQEVLKAEEKKTPELLRLNV